MTKIIALDIDGTLINSNFEITDNTKNALLKAQDQGHILVIASGRDVAGVREYADILNFDKKGGLLSNYNGCRVTNYKTGHILFDHRLSVDDLNELIFFLRDYDLEIFTFKDNKVYTDSEDSWSLKDTQKRLKIGSIIDKYMKKGVDFETNSLSIGQRKDKIDKIYPVVKNKFEDKFTVVRTAPTYIEIMPKGISKGSSLVEIADYYKLSHDDIICFGDEENDHSMFEVAGTGVAMANASDRIKKLSDYVTKSNDEDGIGFYLENFVLK